MSPIYRATLLTGALGLLSAAPASAQYTWTGAAGTGNWNNAGNWSGGLPVSGSATTIALGGTTQTSTNQDLATPFVLNQLSMASSAANGFSVGGGPLQFAGTGAAIALNTPLNNAGALTLSSAIDFAVPTTLTVTNRTALTYDLILAGRLSGAGALTFNGDLFANFAITGRNNTTTGAVTVNAGALNLGAVNALGRTARLGGSSGGFVSTYVAPAPGQGVTGGAFTQAIGNLSGSSIVEVGDPTNSAALLVGFDTTSPDYSFAGSLLMSSTSSHFAKVGPQTMTLTGANGSYRGTTSVRGGSLALQGGGTLTGTSMGTVTVQNGATLRLDNGLANNSNRIGNTAGLTLARGTFRVDGNSAANTDEVLGPLTVGVGQSIVQLVPNAVSAVRVTFGSAVSGASGTVLFTGTGLGSAAFPTANTTAIAFTSAPALVGGGGTGAQTSILPWALGSTTGGTAPDTFTTIGTNGVRPLTVAEFAPYATAGTSNNVRENTGFTVASADTRNSLVTTGGASQSVALVGNLTLTSGAFLNTGAGTQVTGAGTLLFGASGAGTAYMTAQGNLTLAAPATAAAVVKSGVGTLTVQRPVAVSGGLVTVAAGTVAVQNNGSTTTGAFTSGSGVTYQVAPGATLDVSGVTSGSGFTVGTSTRLQGSGSVIGEVTIGSGGILEPTGLPGAGVLAVQDMTLQPGGTYRWQVASAQGANDGITQSKVNGSGTLDLTGLSSGNRFNVLLVPLRAENAAGPVYDFDNTQAASWPIATFATVSGFAPDSFTVDSTLFAAGNSLNGGAFAIGLNGTTLSLVFTPVPEPGVWLAAAGLFAISRYRRRNQLVR